MSANAISCQQLRLKGERRNERIKMRTKKKEKNKRNKKNKREDKNKREKMKTKKKIMRTKERGHQRNGAGRCGT